VLEVADTHECSSLRTVQHSKLNERKHGDVSVNISGASLALELLRARALVQSGSSFEKIAGSGGATVTATHTRLASEDLSRAPLL